jgi:hypothetical protein
VTSGCGVYLTSHLVELDFQKINEAKINKNLKLSTSIY